MSGGSLRGSRRSAHCHRSTTRALRLSRNADSLGPAHGRAAYAHNMSSRSLEDEIDRAERSHLSPHIEADLVEQTYSAAFALTGKSRGDLTDAEVVARLRRKGQGSIRVALLARKRARQTWDLNHSDEGAAAAVGVLTDVAASYLR